MAEYTGEPIEEAFKPPLKLASDATLRDYFAAAALQGLLAGRDILMEPEWYAEETGIIADAMIAERNKRDAQD